MPGVINLTPTIDIFEVAWQLAFVIAFACSIYNVRDSRTYGRAAQATGLPRAISIARKDSRVAWALLLVSFPGLGVGTLALLATTTLTNPNTEVSLLIFSVLLRCAFIAIGAGIAYVAVLETRFRREIKSWNLAPSVSLTTPPSGTV